MDQPIPDFGPRLRELRERAGLTQKEMAARAEMHLQAIVKLEKGNRSPTWPTVVQLSHALGCTCQDFLVAATGPNKPRHPGRPVREDVEGDSADEKIEETKPKRKR
jgi:DNA-binding XRE family transcriptional regulator